MALVQVQGLSYYFRKSSRGAQIQSSSGVADTLLDAGITDALLL